MSSSDVMLFSKNDVILQSEGGGGKKAQKIAVILNVWPLRSTAFVAFKLVVTFCRLQGKRAIYGYSKM